MTEASPRHELAAALERIRADLARALEEGSRGSTATVKVVEAAVAQAIRRVDEAVQRAQRGVSHQLSN